MIKTVRSELTALVALRNSSLLWQPEFLAQSAAISSLPLLFWLSETLRPQITVSLGGQQGVAHLALCQAATRLGLEGRCLVQLDGPEAERFRRVRQDRFATRSAPVLPGRDGFLGAESALLTVNLGDGQQKNLGWMPWLQHLPPRGAAVFYGAEAAGTRILEPMIPAGALVLPLGCPKGPISLVLGADRPKSLAELAESAEAQDGLNGFLAHQEQYLQQSLERQALGGPDPTALRLPEPQTLEDAKEQIARLIDQQAEDLDCLAQHLQAQDEAAAQQQWQQEVALAVEQAEVARQRNIVARLEAGIAGIHAQTENSRQEVRDMSLALQELRDSSSWRLTAPLRRVMRRIRR